MVYVSGPKAKTSCKAHTWILENLKPIEKTYMQGVSEAKAKRGSGLCKAAAETGRVSGIWAQDPGRAGTRICSAAAPEKVAGLPGQERGLTPAGGFPALPRKPAPGHGAEEVACRV